MDKSLVTAGLISSLVGVVILFNFGMPYRLRTGGESLLSVGIQDIDEPRREARYNIFGKCGLMLIVVGTALQVFVVVKPNIVQDEDRIIAMERHIQLQSDRLARQGDMITSLSTMMDGLTTMIDSLKNKEQIGYEASREGYEQNRARIEKLEAQ